MFGFFKRQRRSKTKYFRAHLEFLEDRTAPATITLSGAGRFQDGAPTSLVYLGNNNYTAANLRSAIIGVNNLAGPDTILLENGTYTMNSILGQFIVSDLTGNLTIQNGSGGISTIDAQTLSRVFLNQSQLTLSGLKISDGLASDWGGAIYNTGILNITNCQFMNNEALGGLDGSAVAGGAIFNSVNSVLNVQNTTFANNVALGGTSSVLFGGSAAASGGAIYFAGGAGIVSDTILDCSFVNNLAQGGAGAALNGFGARGGQAAGGGIFAQAGNYDLNVFNDTFATNVAQGGQGALGDGGNAAGGGLYLQNGGLGTMRVVNDTIVNNHALGGRGIGALVQNGVGSGGGLASNFLSTPLAKVINTIVAKNTGNIDNDVNGIFSSLGSNLIGDNNGASASFNAGTGDFTGTTQNPLNPALQTLGNYGGPTQTFCPQPGSFVLDRGDSSVATGPLQLTTDQRGDPRRAGSGVDIGSYEVIQSGQNKSYSLVQGSTLTTTVATGLLAGYNNPLDKSITVQLVPGSGPVSGKLTLNANGTFSYVPVKTFVGTVSFKYQIVVNGIVWDTFTVTLSVHH